MKSSEKLKLVNNSVFEDVENKDNLNNIDYNTLIERKIYCSLHSIPPEYNFYEIKLNENKKYLVCINCYIKCWNEDKVLTEKEINKKKAKVNKEYLCECSLINHETAKEKKSLNIIDAVRNQPDFDDSDNDENNFNNCFTNKFPLNFNSCIYVKRKKECIDCLINPCFNNSYTLNINSDINCVFPPMINKINEINSDNNSIDLVVNTEKLNCIAKIDANYNILGIIEYYLFNENYFRDYIKIKGYIEFYFFRYRIEIFELLLKYINKNILKDSNYYFKNYEYNINYNHISKAFISKPELETDFAVIFSKMDRIKEFEFDLYENIKIINNLMSINYYSILNEKFRLAAMNFFYMKKKLYDITLIIDILEKKEPDIRKFFNYIRYFNVFCFQSVFYKKQKLNSNMSSNIFLRYIYTDSLSSLSKLYINFTKNYLIFLNVFNDKLIKLIKLAFLENKNAITGINKYGILVKIDIYNFHKETFLLILKEVIEMTEFVLSFKITKESEYEFVYSVLESLLKIINNLKEYAFDKRDSIDINLFMNTLLNKFCNTVIITLSDYLFRINFENLNKNNESTSFLKKCSINYLCKKLVNKNTNNSNNLNYPFQYNKIGILIHNIMFSFYSHCKQEKNNDNNNNSEFNFYEQPINSNECYTDIQNITLENKMYDDSYILDYFLNKNDSYSLSLLNSLNYCINTNNSLLLSLYSNKDCFFRNIFDDVDIDKSNPNNFFSKLISNKNKEDNLLLYENIFEENTDIIKDLRDSIIKYESVELYEIVSSFYEEKAVDNIEKLSKKIFSFVKNKDATIINNKQNNINRSPSLNNSENVNLKHSNTYNKYSENDKNLIHIKQLLLLNLGIVQRLISLFKYYITMIKILEKEEYHRLCVEYSDYKVSSIESLEDMKNYINNKEVKEDVRNFYNKVYQIKIEKNRLVTRFIEIFSNLCYNNPVISEIFLDKEIILLIFKEDISDIKNINFYFYLFEVFDKCDYKVNLTDFLDFLINFFNIIYSKYCNKSDSNKFKDDKLYYNKASYIYEQLSSLKKKLNWKRLFIKYLRLMALIIKVSNEKTKPAVCEKIKNFIYYILEKKETADYVKNINSILKNKIKDIDFEKEVNNKDLNINIFELYRYQNNEYNDFNIDNAEYYDIDSKTSYFLDNITEEQQLNSINFKDIYYDYLYHIDCDYDSIFRYEFKNCNKKYEEISLRDEMFLYYFLNVISLFSPDMQTRLVLEISDKRSQIDDYNSFLKTSNKLENKIHIENKNFIEDRDLDNLKEIKKEINSNYLKRTNFYGILNFEDLIRNCYYSEPYFKILLYKNYNKYIVYSQNLHKDLTTSYIEYSNDKKNSNFEFAYFTNEILKNKKSSEIIKSFLKDYNTETIINSLCNYKVYVKLYEYYWTNDNIDKKERYNLFCDYFKTTILDLTYNCLFKLYYYKSFDIKSEDFQELELEEQKLYKLHKDAFNICKDNIEVYIKYINSFYLNNKKLENIKLLKNEIKPLHINEYNIIINSISESKETYVKFKQFILKLVLLFLDCLKFYLEYSHSKILLISNNSDINIIDKSIKDINNKNYKTYNLEILMCFENIVNKFDFNTNKDNNNKNNSLETIFKNFEKNNNINNNQEDNIISEIDNNHAVNNINKYKNNIYNYLYSKFNVNNYASNYYLNSKSFADEDIKNNIFYSIYNDFTNYCVNFHCNLKELKLNYEDYVQSLCVLNTKIINFVNVFKVNYEYAQIKSLETMSNLKTSLNFLMINIIPQMFYLILVEYVNTDRFTTIHELNTNASEKENKVKHGIKTGIYDLDLNKQNDHVKKLISYKLLCSIFELFKLLCLGSNQVFQTFFLKDYKVISKKNIKQTNINNKDFLPEGNTKNFEYFRVVLNKLNISILEYLKGVNVKDSVLRYFHTNINEDFYFNDLFKEFSDFRNKLFENNINYSIKSMLKEDISALTEAHSEFLIIPKINDDALPIIDCYIKFITSIIEEYADDYKVYIENNIINNLDIINLSEKMIDYLSKYSKQTIISKYNPKKKNYIVNSKVINQNLSNDLLYDYYYKYKHDANSNVKFAVNCFIFMKLVADRFNSEKVYKKLNNLVIDQSNNNLDVHLVKFLKSIVGKIEIFLVSEVKNLKIWRNDAIYKELGNILNSDIINNKAIKDLTKISEEIVHQNKHDNHDLKDNQSNNSDKSSNSMSSNSSSDDEEENKLITIKDEDDNVYFLTNVFFHINSTSLKLNTISAVNEIKSLCPDTYEERLIYFNTKHEEILEELNLMHRMYFKNRFYNYIFNFKHSNLLLASCLISLVINMWLLIITYNFKSDKEASYDIVTDDTNNYEKTYKSTFIKSDSLNYITILSFVNCLICLFSIIHYSIFEFIKFKNKLKAKYSEVNKEKYIHSDKYGIYKDILYFFFNTKLLPFVWNLFFGVLALLNNNYVFLYSFQLFSLTLINKTMSLVFTSIYIRLDKFLTTAILALIIGLIYAAITFYFYYKPWIESGYCISYMNCFVTMIALSREGGGINDVLPLIDLNDKNFWIRLFYDWIYFFLIILLLLNIFNGIVVDTYQELRELENLKNYFIENVCYICDIHRSKFQMNAIDFEFHEAEEHSIINYFHYFTKIKTSNIKDLNTTEHIIYRDLLNNRFIFFPMKKSLSISNK